MDFDILGKIGDAERLNASWKAELMKPEYVLCVKNDGYAASLEPFKIYRKISALESEKARGRMRVIDESGEDYLFPSKYFISNPVSAQIGEILAKKFRAVEKQKMAA